MYKSSITIFKIKTIAAFVIFVLFWLGMALSTQYLSSSFHIQEDHEIIDHVNNIHSQGYWYTLTNEIKNDLDGRFRPLYIAYRCTCSYLFGFNLLYWHLLVFFIQLGLMMLLFRIGQLLQFSFWVSILLPFIFVTGSVTESIIRLGTSELFGALFFTAAVCLVLKYPIQHKSKSLINFWVHIFVLLACFTKESFITLIPIIVALKLFTFQKVQNSYLRTTIIQNTKFILCELTILAFCIGVIKFHLSQQNESLYGGFDGNFKNTITLLLNTIFSDTSVATTIAGNGIYFLYIFIGFLTVGFYRSALSNENKQNIIFFSGVCFFITSVQYLIHAKIVLEGHYLIPFMYAPSFLICILADGVLQCSNKTQKYLTYLTLVVLLVLKSNQSYAQLVNYTSEGSATVDVLKQIHPSMNNALSVLIVGDELIHMEHFAALSKYLQHTFPDKTRVLLKLLPTDYQKFMNIAGTNDPSILPEMQRIVQMYFQDFFYTRDCPYQDFDVIIILSESEQRFLKIYGKPDTFNIFSRISVGKSWYQYTLYQKRI